MRAVFPSSPPHSSHPLLRAINLSIAVLLIALLRRGVLVRLAAVAANLGRDHGAGFGEGHGVARRAGRAAHPGRVLEDAIFLQGFVTAQDRMWQMDALRRLAAGELAEVVGKAALESDEECAPPAAGAHRRDSRKERCPRPIGEVLAAYARGVNYYLETHRGNLPLEFTLLKYDPRPWTPRDSMLAGLQMYRQLTTSWRDEISKLHMVQKGDRAKVDFLFPQRTGAEIQPGSNAWAVSGAHTASGKPILANDPHLDFSLPSTWYMVHLRAPGLNVSGVALPGIPAVIIGHNERIAWGVTNLQFDVQDLYREQIDPQSGRYVYRGQMEQAHLERDAIAVKGEKPLQFDQWVTRHGPVFLNDQGQQYALRWSAAEPDGFEFPFLDIDRARNWTEFTAAIARFPGPGQNFVYADVDGNIGYHATGRLPIRPPNCGGDVPADGASGECEWQGYMPFSDLPQFFNPAPGMVVTANQNPFPPDYKYPVGGKFCGALSLARDSSFARRSRQVETGGNARRAERRVLGVLMISWRSRWWRRSMRARTTIHNCAEAVDLLRNWNGQMEKGTAAPAGGGLLYQELQKAAADRAAPGQSDQTTISRWRPP